MIRLLEGSKLSSIHAFLPPSQIAWTLFSSFTFLTHGGDVCAFSSSLLASCLGSRWSIYCVISYQCLLYNYHSCGRPYTLDNKFFHIDDNEALWIHREVLLRGVRIASRLLNESLLIAHLYQIVSWTLCLCLDAERKVWGPSLKVLGSNLDQTLTAWLLQLLGLIFCTDSNLKRVRIYAKRSHTLSAVFSFHNMTHLCDHRNCSFDIFEPYLDK